MPKGKQREKERRSIGSHILTAVCIILCILLAVILVANVTILIRGAVDSDNVPKLFGYGPLIVRSGSMEPAIETGDMIFIQSAAFDEMQVGDIATYYLGKNLVTHRVTEIREVDGVRQLITRGDANNADDPDPVTAEMLQGVYVGKVAGLGDAVFFLQTPTGMILLVVLPLLLLIGIDALRRRRVAKVRQDRETELLKEMEALKAQHAGREQGQ